MNILLKVVKHSSFYKTIGTIIAFINKTQIMKTKKHKIIGSVPTIKVRLDHRTTITVRTKDALKGWLSKYPEAKVIS